MNNCRAYFRNFRRGISIFLITFGMIMLVASRPVKKGPHPAVFNKAPYDTLGIMIDPAIRDSFLCIYNLLQQLISEKKGIFWDPLFHDFFASPATRLVFSVRAFPEELGAESDSAVFDRQGYFRDTIFINETLYDRMSKEYLTAVLIHEAIHAYISWCFVCGFNREFEVNEDYLKKRFHADWKMFTDTPFADGNGEHDIMSRHFIGIMKKHLLLHIHQTDPGLRDDIGTALTWGGLTQTAGWKRLSEDKCYLNAIDICSLNVNAGPNFGTKHDNCGQRDIDFLHGLQLEPLCKEINLSHEKNNAGSYGARLLHDEFKN